MTLDGDPVSWLMIEPGWQVADRDGAPAGTVAEVLGDTNIDIFDGLAVSLGLTGKPRYAPSERVGEIVTGTVQLELTRAEIDGLPEHDGRPHSETI